MGGEKYRDSSRKREHRGCTSRPAWDGAGVVRKPPDSGFFQATKTVTRANLLRHDVDPTVCEQQRSKRGPLRYAQISQALLVSSPLPNPTSATALSPLVSGVGFAVASTFRTSFPIELI
ncbi:hypothetical protein MTP99_009021 [Tenebrio molitor]|nr:hypothetical protein MTP99_009021 [Tenebrio molitor]